MKHHSTEQRISLPDRIVLAAGGLAIRNLWMFPGLRRQLRSRWVDARKRTAPPPATTVHVGDVAFTQTDQRPPRLRFHLVFPRPGQPIEPSTDCPCEGDRSRCACGAY